MTATPASPTRVLLLGGGGREHALAWRLLRDPGVEAVLALPGSDAIAALPGVALLAGDPCDAAAVVAAAHANAADLVVVGPEAPLAAAVADGCAVAGLPCFGPIAAAARIETSKSFCHAVAAAAGIPMARARVATSVQEARDAVAAEVAHGRGVVLKDDGLAAGKGVIVLGPEEAGTALGLVEELYAAGPARTLVVEERLEGPEASVIALCDGRVALALPAARDHKRLGDGDAGPNTGGMGAYSPLPDLPDDALTDVVGRFHLPALAELARRGIPFVGALYAGLMLTADRGPVLLEFNARFGDPETQAILPRLAVPLAPLLLAAARGDLGSVARSLGVAGNALPALPGAAVAVVMATRDYPTRPAAGDPITGLDEAAANGLVFHAGTRRTAAGGWETAGGRVLAVVGEGPDLATARSKAEAGAAAIEFPGARRRHDIGAAAVGMAGAASRQALTATASAGSKGALG